MEVVGYSLPKDLEAYSVHCVESARLSHFPDDRRADRWMTMLDVHLIYTFVLVVFTTPLAIFAVGTKTNEDGTLRSERYDALLCAAYMIIVFEMTILFHCKSILENLPTLHGYHYALSWRTPLQVWKNELSARLQYHYVKSFARCGSYLNLVGFLLMSSGCIDMIWQHYRFLAATCITTCVSLVLLQSVISLIPSQLSSHLIFRRASVIFVYQALVFVFGGSWGPQSMVVLEDRKKQEREMRKVVVELAHWFQKDSSQYVWMGQRAGRGNLEKMTVANHCM